MKRLVSLEREKIYLDLWRLSWPVMTFMVFQTTLELADLFWVARLGTASVAALSLCNNLFWLLFTFSEGITISTLALTARYRGADDVDGVTMVARHSFWMSAILSVIVIALLFGLGDLFISFYDVDAEVHSQAMVYLKVVGISMAFSYWSMSLGASLQGVGDTRAPMIIQVISNIINIGLDPILIFGMFGLPALGILGAALATLLARIIGFAMLLYIILTGTISPSKLKITGLFGFNFRKEYFRRLMEIGLPALLQSMTRPLSSLFMMKIVALFGMDTLAAYGIGSRVLGLSFILISGLTVGTATMVGQSLGAEMRNLTGEIVRKAMVIAVLLQGVTAGVCFLTAPFVVGLFAEDLAIIRIGANFLKILSAGFILIGINHIIDAVFKGSGYTMPSMASALVANWLVKLPGAYYLAVVVGMSTNGIWWAIIMSFVAEFIFLFVWYRQGRWMNREILIHDAERTSITY